MDYICPICGNGEVEFIYTENVVGGETLGCDECVKQFELDEVCPTQEQKKEAAEDMKLDESRGK